LACITLKHDEDIQAKITTQHKTFLSLTAWLILGSLLAACQTPEIVPEVFSPNASHQEYERSLIGQNLAQTPMGQAWIAAGDPAENPSAINLIPFQEQRLFDPAVPDAAYYLFEGIIGQRVKISILTEAETGYFADLFSLESPDSRAPWYPAEGYKETWSENRFRPVATALGELGSNPPASEVQLSPKAAILGSSQIIMEPREERFYLLRLQPRLLEGGQFNVTVNADPLLSWPVKDSNLEDTWSFFGAPRDGGGRVHHGIDIFAPGEPISWRQMTSTFPGSRPGSVGAGRYSSRTGIGVLSIIMPTWTTGLRASSGDNSSQKGPRWVRWVTPGTPSPLPRTCTLVFTRAPGEGP
jgi:hypothetical protein